MSLQEVVVSKPLPSSIFEAKVACDMKLPARVADAEFKVPIKKFTDVLAEDRGADGVLIMWSYGLGTAEAMVTHSVLLFE